VGGLRASALGSGHCVICQLPSEGQGLPSFQSLEVWEVLRRVGSMCPVVRTAAWAVSSVPGVLAGETALLKTVTVRLPSVSGAAFCLLQVARASQPSAPYLSHLEMLLFPVSLL